MRKNKISDALNHLDDDLITMTDDLMSGKRTGTIIKKIVMVSAAAAVILLGIAAVTQRHYGSAANSSTPVDISSNTDIVTEESSEDTIQNRTEVPTEVLEDSTAENPEAGEAVRQTVRGFYESLIEAYRGEDIHITETYLDMNEIQSKNVLTALECISFSKQYLKTEYNITEEEGDYPYTIEFKSVEPVADDEIKAVIFMDLEAGETYPPFLSEEEHTFYLRKLGESWKIYRHDWSGIGMFEVFTDQPYEFDQEERKAQLDEIAGWSVKDVSEESPEDTIRRYFDECYDYFIKLEVPDLSDVLDMDVIQNKNKVEIFREVVDNWKWYSKEKEKPLLLEKLEYKLSFKEVVVDGDTAEVNVELSYGENGVSYEDEEGIYSYPHFLTFGLNHFVLKKKEGRWLIISHDNDSYGYDFDYSRDKEYHYDK